MTYPCCTETKACRSKPSHYSDGSRKHGAGYWARSIPILRTPCPRSLVFASCSRGTRKLNHSCARLYSARKKRFRVRGSSTIAKACSAPPSRDKRNLPRPNPYWWRAIGASSSVKPRFRGKTAPPWSRRGRGSFNFIKNGENRGKREEGDKNTIRTTS